MEKADEGRVVLLLGKVMEGVSMGVHSEQDRIMKKFLLGYGRKGEY